MNCIQSNVLNNYIIFFLNPILFAICTSAFSKLCVSYILACLHLNSGSELVQGTSGSCVSFRLM
jgi:hypothetical protein